MLPGSAIASSRAAMLTAVAEQVSAFDDHIADMDADPEKHRLFFGQIALSLPRACCTATAHRTASTALAKSATMLSPAVLKIRPAMYADQPVEDPARGFEPSQRADLVPPHQPAVAGDVGGENRRELAFDRWIRHA